IAESVFLEFGDIVAAARAQLSTDLVNRQVVAMDAWHRTGIGNRVREINVPVLVATGTADIVIPPSNALKLVNAIPGAWLAQFNGGGHALCTSIRVRSPISSIAFSSLGEPIRADLPSGSTRPGFPAFADWLCVAVDVDLFQTFHTIFHRVGRSLIFFPG